MSVWRALTRPARWAALLAGALPVLAFPAPDLGWLAWFGLVPGLLLMRAAPAAREAAVRGWWSGAGFMLAAHYWLAPNIGPGLLLVAIVFGLLWTGVAVSTWALLRPPVRAGRALAALAVVPSYWLVIEWIRSWQALGGPWALLGASQWRYPPMLALAAVGGVWLVTFAIVAANVGLVILITARPLPLRLLGAAGTAAVVAAGPVAYALTAPVAPQRFLTVALVQPGLDHNPAVRAAASRRLSEGLAARHPGLIVWGESSIGFDLHTSPPVLGRIEQLSRSDGAEILVNQDSLVPGGKSKTAMLVGPHGIRGTYVKSRLVPFGEYIPFRGQLGWLTRISRAARVNMIPGPGARVLTITGPRIRPVRAGVLICFESAFPDMSRSDARQGAQLLVYQTSDSTFQQSWAPAQHASLAALRAAETGRPAVQAALTGDSVAFDARGRLLGSLTTSQRGVLVVRVGLPPASALTPFDRVGEIVPWLAILIAVVAAAVAVIPPGRTDHPLEIPLADNHRRVPSVFIMKRSPGEGPVPSPPDQAAPDQGGDDPSSRRARRLPAQVLPPSTHPPVRLRVTYGGPVVLDSDHAPQRQRSPLSGRWARLAMTAAVSVSAGLFAAACQGAAASNAQQPGGHTAPATPATPPAQVSITPANGARNAKPDKGVTVLATGGKISDVTVTAHGKTVQGTLNSAGTLWQTSTPLATGTSYSVTATATGAGGKTVTQTSTFRTLTPSASYSVATVLGYKQDYGVGMPIMLNFSQPVENKYKAGVERAIQITSSKPVVGSWFWDGDQTLLFRPQNYWPQNTNVSFDGHFTGVAIAPGVYGSADLTQAFHIGWSLIAIASTRTHYMQVYYKGKLLGNWPISTGQPGDDTADGTYLTIEKGNPTRMIGNGYNVLVPYAVRFTWSGNYIHDAYWSVAQQGVTNVSHGCVNVSPAHSEIYYNLAVPGDPVTITGSPVAGQWDDGWTPWFLTWKHLLKGSATGMAVQVGPQGSTLVSPGSVTSSPQYGKLHGAKPYNYLAGTS